MGPEWRWSQQCGAQLLEVGVQPVAVSGEALQAGSGCLALAHRTENRAPETQGDGVLAGGLHALGQRDDGRRTVVRAVLE